MKAKKEANWYDKIFKENLEAVTMGLIEKVLGIQVATAEKLEANLPKTIERKPDQLLKITDQAGETFLLHLEFQLADEDYMAERMLEYWILLWRKYHLSIRQYVFFLSDVEPKMASFLHKDQTQYAFDLISIAQIDYQIFLSSTHADEVVFAVLGNIGMESPQTAARKVVERLSETADSVLVFEKYLEQLRILANLRKLKPFIEQIMESITKYFKPEDDLFYQKGMEKGKQEALERQQQEIKAMIQRFLQEGLLTTQQIATGIGVTEAFVEQIKREMEG